MKLLKNDKEKLEVLEKVVEKWNKNIPKINEWIKSSKKDHADFYWNQLVWQEIDMYITIGEYVDQEEFDFICKRRGFDYQMKKYLKELIEYAGLSNGIKLEKL